jgi:hypothetical protein
MAIWVVGALSCNVLADDGGDGAQPLWCNAEKPKTAPPAGGAPGLALGGEGKCKRQVAAHKVPRTLGFSNFLRPSLAAIVTPVAHAEPPSKCNPTGYIQPPWRLEWQNMTWKKC